jgi:hypothetical protein
MKNNKKAISLIVLVITIIVIIILTGALIFSLVDNNPILQASKATFMKDINSFQEELRLYNANQFLENLGGYNSKLLQADYSSVTYGGQVVSNKTIKDLIKSLDKAKKYEGKLKIVNGRLIFESLDINENEWAEEMDAAKDITAPVKATLVANPSSWTNGDVTVTITYSNDSTIKKYSLNGTTWNEYTSPIVISNNNTTVYALSTDDVGNESEQSTLTVANIDKTISNSTNYAGNILYPDSSFQSGRNGISTYNNMGNGTVTTIRTSMSDLPTGSGYGLEIKTTGTSSPGWGGFYFATPSSANKVFITRIIANIPLGYRISWASNPIGTGGTNTWLTSQNGTGTWEEYVCKVTCGSSGTFSSTNFFYISGGTAPTPSAPLIWKVAYATVFDTTKWSISNSVVAITTDTSGIVGYGINQSNTIEPTFTNIVANINFAAVLDNIISNGTYYVWLKDQAGNTTNSSIVVSYIDRIAPAVTASNNGTTSSSINVMATASDAGGSGLKTNAYEYSKDNGITWTAASSSTTYNFTGLTSGTYECKVRVTDNAGNVTTSVAVAISTQ